VVDHHLGRRVAAGDRQVALVDGAGPTNASLAARAASASSANSTAPDAPRSSRWINQT
jgi:hypothetical protein